MSLFYKMFSVFKEIRRYLKSKESSKFVKKYYQKNKGKFKDFQKNKWSSNFYWDFFIQRLPHAVRSDYFVPYDYYSFKIEYFLNDRNTSNLVDLKNLYDKLFNFPEVRIPKTVLRVMNGLVLDEKYVQVSNPNKVLRDFGRDIITKPASSSYGGEGILKYCFVGGVFKLANSDNVLSINDLLLAYQGEFIIQECLTQHKELGKFHPNSINTVRILSYRSIKDNVIHFPSPMLRIGRGGKHVDNVSAGGMAVGIENDGRLMKYAFDMYGNYFMEHPDTHLPFEGNRIPAFEKIKEAICSLANILAYQRIVGWDFTVDENENPVLIEMNLGVGTWMQQVATGRPLFGEFSEEIYKYIKTRDKR